ncbi:MAG: sigma 54-interacting transcriptional regulator [Deltaproteobacteria bacterium]|nr:sigma 54-interacting transcriptional regulator [Deltaproteobacteria bacterium]
MDLETALWREVSRHMEIRQCVEHLSRVLGERFPLARLLVRRLEQEHTPAILLTAAFAGPCPGPLPAHVRTLLEEPLLRSVRRWLRAGRAAALSRGSPLGNALAPEDLHGALLAGPLAVDGRVLGVAVLEIRAGEALSEAHVELFQAALGPLAVALENDRRQQEIVRMREALEADRAALLTRLQRQDISEVVIGIAGGLKGVMERVEQVAPTGAPVLIHGETGSGKEVIARAIHARSRRARGPVVRVNCGAIPPELVDSELFGHERGAFTGAVAARRGWFERADGGTLFLDEIGELPLAAQVRLLRVLQDGTLERVGGQESVTVDVRVVAATNRHLEDLVTEGRFREDLWYRLCVFPIRLPALRERVQDIPALAAHFAAGAGRRLGGAPLVPCPADLDLLVAYPWPGNVRELAAVIERAAILGNGKRLEIPAALGTGLQARPLPLTGDTVPAPSARPLGGPIVPLDQAMRGHIEDALRACHGRIEGPFGVGRLLGINPHTLRARMRKLGIRWARFRDRAPAEA